MNRRADRAPRVSVITIFYEAEAYLGEAIESVLAQNFEDLEYLLVDDGSTDSSSDIARDYALRDSRIRLLEHPGHLNLGMSATRNLGLREARGEFVAFIDADDRWRRSKLGEQLGILDRMPEVDAVGGAVNYWEAHSGRRDRIVPTGHVQNHVIAPGEATVAFYPLGKAHAPSMSDLLFRKPSIDAVGGFEENFRGAYEDQAFLAKFYLSGTLYVTDTVWSDYRLHPNSCMATVARDGTYDLARREFLRWFEAHLSTTDFRDDLRINKALARSLKTYPEKGGIREATKSIPFAVPLVRATRNLLGRLRSAVTGGPAILMYHRIADETFDPWGLAVSPVRFEEQLEWIAHNRLPLPLVEFVKRHREGRLPRNAIAVTFDDGYACVKKAKPLLERFGVPATVFLPPDLIERRREFWWDELERIVLDHWDDCLQWNGRKIDFGRTDPGDRNWLPADPPRTSRQLAYREIYDLLYEMPQADLDAAMHRLRETAKVPDAPRETHRPLAPEEITALNGTAIEFGSHALTHPSLPRLNARDKATEIQESMSRCAALTGQPPRTFAFPYGDHDPQSQKLVEEAGFLCACRADGSFVRSNTDRFALPRIFVGNWSTGRLAQVLGRT